MLACACLKIYPIPILADYCRAADPTYNMAGHRPLHFTVASIALHGNIEG
jgi:hypothetical protein